MALPGVGTTPGAQSSNQSIAATADANGNIMFVGPSGIQGSTITCVTTVPNAPAAALFSAMLGGPTGLGVALQTWLGGSTAGRFQVGVGQTIVVKGTGMVPGVQYTCTFAAIIDVGDVQVIIPEPNSSITGTAPSIAVFQFFAAGGANQTFTIPANVSALTVDMAGAQGGTEPINGTPGGKGCRIQCTIAVVPGQVLTINVGKQAIASGTTSPGGVGLHPGGTGGKQADGVGQTTSWGMGGGGSSGIQNAVPATLAEAGGGGGASISDNVSNGDVHIAAGGAAGVNGANGTSQPAAGPAPILTVAGGATTVAGGAGATTASAGFTNGSAGTAAAGGGPGAGASGGGTGTAGVGGAGGGGTFGGGGGTSGFFGGGLGELDTAAASGGGGSSTTAAAVVSGVTFTPGFQAGDGYVTLSYVVL